MKKQYNVIEVKKDCYEYILLIEGGEFSDNYAPMVYFFTSTDAKIVLSKKVNIDAPELIFKSMSGFWVGLDSKYEYTALVVTGTYLTLNQKPFEDEYSARLFFEIY